MDFEMRKKEKEGEEEETDCWERADLAVLCRSGCRGAEVLSPLAPFQPLYRRSQPLSAPILLPSVKLTLTIG